MSNNYFFVRSLVRRQNFQYSIILSEFQFLSISKLQDYESEHHTERPVPPTISVVISTPVIQIIDVGETVRVNCSAYHNIKRVSIDITFSTQISELQYVCVSMYI